MLPQSYHLSSGYRIQGKTKLEAEKIFEDAIAVQESGAFSVVLEGIPTDLAIKITNALDIPTIGIGAGLNCDGQIQVLHDLVGFFNLKIPKHAKSYVNVEKKIKDGIKRYQLDVKNYKFPKNRNTTQMNPEELLDLKKKIEDL